MLGRHVYRVTPAADGAWRVSKDGAPETIERRPTRQAALERACELAKGDEPARVVVESGDGKLLEERKFGLDPGQNIGPA